MQKTFNEAVEHFLTELDKALPDASAATQAAAAQFKTNVAALQETQAGDSEEKDLIVCIKNNLQTIISDSTIEQSANFAEIQSTADFVLNEAAQTDTEPATKATKEEEGAEPAKEEPPAVPEASVNPVKKTIPEPSVKQSPRKMI